MKRTIILANNLFLTLRLLVDDLFKILVLSVLSEIINFDRANRFI